MPIGKQLISNNPRLHDQLSQQYGHKGLLGWRISDQEAAAIEAAKITDMPSINGIECLPNLRELTINIKDGVSVYSEDYVPQLNAMSSCNVTICAPRNAFSNEALSAMRPDINLDIGDVYGVVYSPSQVREINEGISRMATVDRTLPEHEQIASIYQNVGMGMKYPDSPTGSIHDQMTKGLYGGVVERHSDCSGTSATLCEAYREAGFEARMAGGVDGKGLDDLGHHQWVEVLFRGEKDGQREWHPQDLTFDIHSQAIDFQSTSPSNMKNFCPEPQDFYGPSPAHPEFSGTHFPDPTEISQGLHNGFDGEGQYENAFNSRTMFESHQLTTEVDLDLEL